jgi:hypothetical protein
MTTIHKVSKIMINEIWFDLSFLIKLINFNYYIKLNSPKL